MKTPAVLERSSVAAVTSARRLRSEGVISRRCVAATSIRKRWCPRPRRSRAFGRRATRGRTLLPRADARETERLDRTRRRNAQAGVDMAFQRGSPFHRRLTQDSASVRIPVVVNLVQGGRTPVLGADELPMGIE